MLVWGSVAVRKYSTDEFQSADEADNAQGTPGTQHQQDDAASFKTAELEQELKEVLRELRYSENSRKEQKKSN